MRSNPRFLLMLLLFVSQQIQAQSPTDFALEIYKLTVVDSSNSVISPISIQIALALLQEGAGGETKKGLQQLLSGDKVLEAEFYLSLKRKLEFQTTKPYQDCQAFTSTWGNKGSSTDRFNIYNSVWLSDELSLNPEFISKAKKNYDSEVSILSKDEIKQSKAMMDAWIKLKSNGKINSADGGISPDKPFSILNATYFFGHWQYPFDKERTKSDKFLNYRSEKIETDFMRGKFAIEYSEESDFQAVKLPYECDGMAMILIVPKKNLGLSDFEKELDPKKLQRLLSMKEEQVILKMPKFKVKNSFSVLSALNSMGLSDLSNLSNVSLDSRLVVGDILHKAFIDVSEESTEAAALTEVVITGGTGSRSEPPPPKIVTADHPFMFLLINEATQVITFIGRVVDFRQPLTVYRGKR